MSLVNFTSGINKIEQNKPLSEWAREFIRSNELTRENFTEAGIFQSLIRSQKDAVRYQLRKLSRPHGASLPKRVARPSNTITIHPKAFRFPEIWKLALGVWISGFLLFDIARIYIAKGLPTLIAWQAAILVEICFLVASTSRNPTLRKAAYILFAYNVVLFGFGEVDQIMTRIVTYRTEEKVKADKEKRVISLSSQLEKLDRERAENIERLHSSHLHGYITSGTKSFEKVDRILGLDSKQQSEHIAQLENEISIPKNSQGILWVIIGSTLYFLLRSVLQLFSIWLLEDRP